MLTLSAREANQNFARIMRAASAGEEVVITKRGVPVAKVVPIVADERNAARQAAIARMRARMEKGLSLGGNAWPGREALYEDMLSEKS